MLYDKLPKELLAKPRKTLADLKPGDKIQFPLHSVLIGEDRTAYVVLKSEVDIPVRAETEYGELLVDDQGAFHLTLPADVSQRWRFSETPKLVKVNENLNALLKKGNNDDLLAPIKTITWDGVVKN